MDSIIAGYNTLGLGLTKIGEDPDLLKFHAAAQDTIQAEVKKVSDSARTLDPDLMPAARKARLVSIFATGRARLEARLTALVESTFGARLKAARTNFTKAQAVPTDPVERLAFEARIGEARRQIEGLSQEARFRALRDLADKADPRTLGIMRDSVVPLVPPDVQTALESRFFAAAAGPEAAYLEATTDAIEEATDITKAAYVALGSVASRLGMSLADFSSVKPAGIVAGLPPSVSALLVARFGQDALDELGTGKRSLSDLFDLI